MLAADLDILARTIWGEARGEGLDGMRAVGHVMINRARGQHRHETTIVGVCTEPYQFSCWNRSDPNRKQLEALTLDNHIFRLAYRAALEAYDAIDDPTKGATHYHVDHIKPAWSEGHQPTAHIGRHLFYAGIA